MKYSETTKADPSNWSSGYHGFPCSPGALYTMGYPSKTHLKPKSHEISFPYNLFPNYQLILGFCTNHDSITAVHSANFQNDGTNKTDVIDEPVFTRFEFKLYIAQGPCNTFPVKQKYSNLNLNLEVYDL